MLRTGGRKISLRALSLLHKRTVPDGAVAQLVERVVRNDEVRGSIPLSSTIRSAAIKLGVSRIRIRLWRLTAIAEQFFEQSAQIIKHDYDCNQHDHRDNYRCDRIGEREHEKTGRGYIFAG